MIAENMSLPLNPSSKTETVIRDFFEHTNVNETADALGVMLEHYIQNAPVERIDLANKATLVNRLNQLFFNLKQALQE